jgi:hypothetical protein
VHLAGAALATAAVSLLAFADDGYLPGAWRASAVAFSAVAALTLVLGRRITPTRLQVAAVVGMGALCGWTALSALWSASPGDSLDDAQRTLVYVTALMAALLVRGRLLPGAVAGIVLVCAYALAERLLEGPPSPPDPFEGTLLHEPLGYANALAALAAVGLAASLGLLAAQSGRRALLVATATLLLVTLALTGSRGGWAAAVVGSAVALAAALGRPVAARAIAAVAGIGLVVVLALSAGSLADDLAAHGGDRPYYWTVAWNEAAEAPLMGNGAGTFHLAWLEQQPVPVTVRDAHSLYLETLAELGVVGLALLALALAPPLAAAFRSRAGAAAAGGYVTFLLHAGIDWDWEMPAVTVAGLLCGAALLVDPVRVGRAGFRLAPHLLSQRGRPGGRQ